MILDKILIVHQFFHDINENSTVLVIGYFRFGVNSGFDFKAFSGVSSDVDNLSDAQRLLQVDIEIFFPGEAQTVSTFIVNKFKRENTHSNKVGPMDSFVAFGDDCLNAHKQGSPLG